MSARPVLVVDDEENIRLTLEEALTAMGLDVETAADGEEALAKLEARAYALVLLDLKMPGLDGMGVLREACRRRPDVPVVLLTAHGTVETAVEAMQIGAVDFLEKPFSLPEIRALVSKVLDQEGQAQQARSAYEHHVEQARASVRNRQLDAALEHARRALARDASRPEAFNVMGVVMQLKMDLEAAQKYYRSATTLDHAYAPARKNLENISGFPKQLSRYELE